MVNFVELFFISRLKEVKISSDKLHKHHIFIFETV